ncbi:MAG: DMT family transporter [Kiritimatiellae bacterium]|nr:DMT family transporter [Kiritimatiellia bacterium]
MTLLAFIFVFCSVFLHATWNCISKSERPSLAFYMLMSGTSACILLPFFVFSDLRLTALPTAFFYLLFASIAAEVMYMAGLAYAYRKSDISLSYPLVRALPVLMVAAITVIFGIGKTPGKTALFGMLLIFVGCLFMPLKSFRDFNLNLYWNKVIVFILLGALGTTGYTIADSSALTLIKKVFERERVMDVLAYLFLIEFGLCVGQMFFVFSIKLERAEFKRLFMRSIYPCLAGVCACSAYGLVLLAMRHVTNVSYVQAFRQMSLPLGFLAGILILKESGNVPKTVGMILIVAGLVTTCLG